MSPQFLEKEEIIKLWERSNLKDFRARVRVVLLTCMWIALVDSSTPDGPPRVIIECRARSKL